MPVSRVVQRLLSSIYLTCPTRSRTETLKSFRTWWGGSSSPLQRPTQACECSASALSRWDSMGKDCCSLRSGGRCDSWVRATQPARLCGVGPWLYVSCHSWRRTYSSGSVNTMVGWVSQFVFCLNETPNFLICLVVIGGIHAIHVQEGTAVTGWPFLAAMFHWGYGMAACWSFHSCKAG